MRIKIIFILLFTSTFSMFSQFQDLKTRMISHSCSCIEKVIDTVENQSIQTEIEACLVYSLDFFREDDELKGLILNSDSLKNFFTEMKILFFTSCVELVKYQYVQIQESKKALLTMIKPEFQKAFVKGQEFFGSKQFDKALNEFMNIYKNDSTNTLVIDYIGLCFRSMRKVDTAVIFFKKSLDYNTENLLAWQNLGDMLLAQSELKESFYAYLKLVEINPSYAEGYFGIGKVLLNNKEYEKAIINIDYALRIYNIIESPFVKDAEFLIGYTYFLKGDSKSAKPWFDKAKEKGFEIPEGIAKQFGYE